MEGLARGAGPPGRTGRHGRPRRRRDGGTVAPTLRTRPAGAAGRGGDRTRRGPRRARGVRKGALRHRLGARGLRRAFPAHGPGDPRPGAGARAGGDRRRRRRWPRRQPVGGGLGRHRPGAGGGPGGRGRHRRRGRGLRLRARAAGEDRGAPVRPARHGPQAGRQRRGAAGPARPLRRTPAGRGKLGRGPEGRRGGAEPGAVRLSGGRPDPERGPRRRRRTPGRRRHGRTRAPEARQGPLPRHGGDPGAGEGRVCF